MMTVSMHTFRAAGPDERALAELMDGSIRTLPQLCSDPQARIDVFMGIACELTGSAIVDTEVRTHIANYDWPGGLGEMEAVVKQMLELGLGSLSLKALLASGWQDRVREMGNDTLGAPLAIMNAVWGARGPVGLKEIAAETHRPLRTVQRYIRHLVNAGRLRREGLGRATRYFAQPSAPNSP